MPLSALRLTDPGMFCLCRRMAILVTAGPTYENLDQVRRLTNFSTGALGSELAGFLAGQGHEVTLLLGQTSTHPVRASDAAVIERFTTTADLMDRMQAKAGPGFTAVFHVAAVSDFCFGQVYRRGPQGDLQPLTPGKLSTREGTLWAELVPTPKIIERLRDWFPQAFLAGWKYEVDGDCNSALAHALDQIERCRTDACVLNGPAYGPGFGLIRVGGSLQHLSDKSSLYSCLAQFLATPSRHPEGNAE
jgi:phosphopantothenate---cysteine ligase (CTP)